MSKEALFNVLRNHFNFDALKVLDLFAGTGNISYEFASRGSDNITSVDGDFGCVKFIKQTAAERFAQNLQSDLSAQPCILAQVNFAHPACAELRDDAVILENKLGERPFHLVGFSDRTRAS